MFFVISLLIGVMGSLFSALFIILLGLDMAAYLAAALFFSICEGRKSRASRCTSSGIYCFTYCLWYRFALGSPDCSVQVFGPIFERGWKPPGGSKITFFEINQIQPSFSPAPRNPSIFKTPSSRWPARKQSLLQIYNNSVACSNLTHCNSNCRIQSASP